MLLHKEPLILWNTLDPRGGHLSQTAMEAVPPARAWNYCRDIRMASVCLVFVKCLSGVCQVFVRCLSGVCQVFVRCLSGVCQVFVMCLSGVCYVFVKCLL